MLVMFGKLSVNFRKKLETINCYVFGRVFYQFALSMNFLKLFPNTSKECSKHFSQTINSFIA